MLNVGAKRQPEDVRLSNGLAAMVLLPRDNPNAATAEHPTRVTTWCLNFESLEVLAIANTQNL